MNSSTVDSEIWALRQRLDRDRQSTQQLIRPQPPASSDAFPRSTTVRFLTTHPLAAAAVAGIVLAIGPRRSVGFALRLLPLVALLRQP